MADLVTNPSFPRTCPSCGAFYKADWAVCIHCDYDRHKGHRVEMQTGDALPPLADIGPTDLPPVQTGSAFGRLRIWLIAALFLVPASLALGIVIGNMFTRFSGSGVPPAAGGVHIEQVESAEKLNLAGQKAVAFRYVGGDLEFWIELEGEGNQQKIGPVRCDRTRLPNPTPSPSKGASGLNEMVEGYFIWVRGDPDANGTEVWQLALERDLVTPASLGVQASPPVAQSKGADSEVAQRASVATLTFRVPVWNGKVMGRSGSAASRFTNPLPSNREVAIMEINEDAKDQEGNITGRHIIKVMCKVIPEKDRAAK